VAVRVARVSGGALLAVDRVANRAKHIPLLPEPTTGAPRHGATHRAHEREVQRVEEQDDVLACRPARRGAAVRARKALEAQADEPRAPLKSDSDTFLKLPSGMTASAEKAGAACPMMAGILAYACAWGGEVRKGQVLRARGPARSDCADRAYQCVDAKNGGWDCT